MSSKMSGKMSGKANGKASGKVGSRSATKRRKSRKVHKALPKRSLKKKLTGPQEMPREVPKANVRNICCNCQKRLRKRDRALFVEEEVGRIFCSEECIAGFFNADIENLEREYFGRLTSLDLSKEEREKYSDLRWATLQEPKEIWQEVTEAGDIRYTLIADYRMKGKRVWCVCICLFLRGQPSFLFIAFSTKRKDMVKSYRRGEHIQFQKRALGTNAEELLKTDGLADEWTEEETLRAQLKLERRGDDIPSQDFELYQKCLEETLQGPDEVWSLYGKEVQPHQVYHFFKFYPNEKKGIWYIVAARETEDDTQIEILDAFPTKDPTLVNKYRQGKQEIGIQKPSEPVSTRVVH